MSFFRQVAKHVQEAPVDVFPSAAAPADGVSMAAVLRAIYNVVFGTTEATGVGSTFWVTKTITSSALTTSAQDLTGVSSGGALEVEQVIIQTNATGLAGATNFRILSNNTNGLAAILEEAVSSLGANKTIDLFTASVVKQRTILESGKKLQYLGTSSSGTGAGAVTVYVKLRRIAATATVAAA